jgi:hypothetical protein
LSTIESNLVSGAAFCGQSAIYSNVVVVEVEGYSRLNS